MQLFEFKLHYGLVTPFTGRRWMDLKRHSIMRRCYRWIVAMLGLLCAVSVQAQTFKMPCDVEATIPALDDKKLPPERIEIEIQGMGKNIFLKTNGSKYYHLITNSLITEDYVGKNLTTEKAMGATRKHKKTGYESEVLIDRQSVVLTAFHDIEENGKKLRVQFTGPCTLPR